MGQMTIRLTEQQIVLLERLLEDGRHGSNLEELVLNLFRDHSSQVLGREYQKP